MWIAVPLAFVRNGLVFDGLPVTPPNPALLGVDNEKKTFTGFVFFSILLKFETNTNQKKCLGIHDDQSQCSRGTPQTSSIIRFRTPWGRRFELNLISLP